MTRNPFEALRAGLTPAEGLLQKALGHLEALLDRQSPAARFQYVDVTFPSGANTDIDIPHSLKAPDPSAIRFQVVSADRAVAVYRDLSGSAKAWTPSVIYLRASVASAACRLLLTVER